MTKVVSVYAPGHLDPYDSYGLIACELVRHISRLNVHVNPISLGDAHHPNQDSELAALTAKPLVMSVGGILLGYPTLYETYGFMANRSPKICITMFESTKLPKRWVVNLNKMDAVVVPSEFCRTVFVENGVTSPVHVIPLGVGSVYKPRARKKQGPFKFLTFLDRGKRKGGLTAIECFLRAFGEDLSVQIVLKSRSPGKKSIPLEIVNPNIHVIQKDMTDRELYNLYVSCHALINPNKGEGFGLIPREFAATGGIALTTNWGGTADHLEQWGWPLPYTMQKADWLGVRNLQDQDLGEWAEPDIDGIVSVLQDIVNNRDINQDLALEQASILHHLYSWKEFASKVYTLWESIANGIVRSTSMAAG